MTSRLTIKQVVGLSGVDTLALQIGALGARSRLDPTAIQSAINDLDLRFDVVLQPFVTMTPNMAGGTLFTNGHWNIWIDLTLVDTTPNWGVDPNYERTLSQSLWHELGHAADFEARYAGLDSHAFETAFNADLERDQELRERAMLARSRAQSQDDLNELLKEYHESPEEIAAEAVAEAHRGEWLTIEGQETHRKVAA